MPDDTLTPSTLTPRVAAIQVKMLHLQYRMKKIFKDQSKLNKKVKKFKTNREKIKGLIGAAYSGIDMLVTMENVYELMQDIFSTTELRHHFDKDTYEMLNRTKKLAERWKPVRNRLGGHLDIAMVESMCVKHNFLGVFLSDDLEADLGVLNMLLFESAINSSRQTSDIFKRDLDLRRNLAAELRVFVSKLNEDWNEVFGYFTPMMELLYRIGKSEKWSATRPDQRLGLVVGD